MPTRGTQFASSYALLTELLYLQVAEELVERL